MKKDIESDPGPIEGQTTFPGFEDPAQPQPEAGAASDVQEEKAAQEPQEDFIKDGDDLLFDDLEVMTEEAREKLIQGAADAFLNETLHARFGTNAPTKSEALNIAEQLVHGMAAKIRAAVDLIGARYGTEEWENAQQFFRKIDILAPYMREEIEARRAAGDTRKLEDYPLRDLAEMGIIDAAQERRRKSLEAIGKTPKEPSKGKQAKDQGAVALGLKLATPSAKGFDDLFDIDKVFGIPENIELESFKDGQLSPIIARNTSLIPQKTVEQAEMASFFQAYLQQDSNGRSEDMAEDEVRFYLPKYYRETGRNPRQKDTGPNDNIKLSRRDDFIAMIARHENRVILLPDGSIYRIAVFKKYDAKSDTITCAFPPFPQIKQQQLLKTAQASGEHQPKELYNKLLHSSAMTEGIYGFEIANRITTALLQRGNTEKPYKARYETIVNDCPQLKARLEQAARSNSKNPSRDYNNILRDAWTAAFRILLKKSDLPQNDPNFSIAPAKTIKGKDGKERKEPIIPTKSTLKNILTIRYNQKTETQSDPQKAVQ